MLTLEQIAAALIDRNLAKVAEKTGYTRAYLASIRAGNQTNPSYRFVKTLSDYLEQPAGAVEGGGNE